MNKAAKANLRVEVFTPAGRSFFGYVSKETITEELAIKTQTYIRENISTLSFFTVFLSTNENPDQEITFPGELIRNSVVITRVVSW